MLATEGVADAPVLVADRRRVAVLVPRYNEEAAIGKVVANFRTALPDAAIYVYDNNSTDCTVERAKAAGAIVCRELKRFGYIAQRAPAEDRLRG